MRLSDYEQHKLDEACSAHMDSVEGERRREAEVRRIKTAADAYLDAVIARAGHGAEPILVADRRFLIACMAGFACDEVIRALGELK